jgi:hypothetical protein
MKLEAQLRAHNQQKSMNSNQVNQKLEDLNNNLEK